MVTDESLHLVSRAEVKMFVSIAQRARVNFIFLIDV